MHPAVHARRLVQVYRLGGRLAVAATSTLCCASALLLVTPARSHSATTTKIHNLSARIAESSAEAGLYLQRGELYRVQRQWKAALADYHRAQQLDPNFRLVEFCLGRMRFEAGEYGAAMEALDRYLAQVPDDPHGLSFRGLTRMALGMPGEASADLTRAIEIQMRDGKRLTPDLFLSRAAALEAAGSNLEEALRGVEQGLTLLGRPVTLEMKALDLEIALRRTAAALARLDRLAAASPRPVSWLARRAEVLEQAGRSQEAARDYQRALELVESLPVSRRKLAAVAELEAGIRENLERLAATSSDEKPTTPHGAESHRAMLAGERETRQ